MDIRVRFNPFAKQAIFDKYIVPALWDYVIEIGESPRILVIDNPIWSNTAQILEKFPNAIVDAINYIPGTHYSKTTVTENVTRYNWMSFDLFRKWNEKRKNKKYNLVYLDTENVLNKVVDSLLYLEPMISAEFNKILIVYSLRGKIGKIKAIDGKNYKQKNINTFFEKNGYQDLNVPDIYTLPYSRKFVRNVTMRLKILVKSQSRKRKRVSEHDLIFLD